MAKKNTIKKNNKAKHKKKSSFKSKMNRCAFLYGTPNVEKCRLLRKQQKMYTDSINSFIDFLYYNDNYDVETFMSILNNSTKSPLLRCIEKDMRDSTGLKSALSQAAFDDAVNKVSNHYNSIKNEMYAFDKNDFVSSKVLFAMSIYGYSRSEMISKVQELKTKKEDLLSKETDDEEIKKLEKDIKFYEELSVSLSNISEDDFNFTMDEFYTWYEVISSSYKKPYCKKCPVRMTSAACKLEESETTDAPFVVSIINPDGRDRIEVPLYTSGRHLVRLKQYKRATTLTYTIREDGSIRVDVSIEKKVEVPKKVSKYIGVDTGITDTFYTSEGLSIGSGSPIEEFYKKTVEPSWAEINKLKQKKRKLKDYLRKHKTELSDEQVKQFRDKIDHIEKNIREHTKKAKRLTNRYHNSNEQLISKVCKEYIKSLKKDTTIVTVIEQLDTKEFNKSKKENSLHSLFIRGKLQKRLMEQLNWNGFQFEEVDPAFTSQICPICGNLDSNNRSDDDKKDFTCTCCGYHDDADHVGALNIKSRVEDEEVQKICEEQMYNQKERHRQIKVLYKKRNEQYVKDHNIIRKDKKEKINK